MAFSAASCSLIGLGGSLVHAGLGVGQRLHRRLQGLGELLPEVFRRLALALGQRDHVPRVVVHPDQPRGYRRPAVVRFGQGPGHDDPGLNVLGQGGGQRRTQDGIDRIAVLLQRVVHLSLFDHGEVPAHDVFHLLTHRSSDVNRSSPSLPGRRQTGSRPSAAEHSSPLGWCEHREVCLAQREGRTAQPQPQQIQRNATGTFWISPTRRPSRTNTVPPWCGNQWAKRDSNPRHPACKAGALNQLSYSP